MRQCVYANWRRGLWWYCEAENHMVLVLNDNLEHYFNFSPAYFGLE